MPDFERPRHRDVWQVLEALDGGFLERARCWFAGGTRIVLELDEYRESADIDFLCADRDGYRAIRTTVSSRSFGEVFRGDHELLRDVRADRYGVRSFIAAAGGPLKIEIVSEGRIALGGERLPSCPVAVLDKPSSIAEKLLANADRGADRSTRARDLVDLAFMAARWSEADLAEGRARAEGAYGETIGRALAAALARFADESWRERCLDDLAVTRRGELVGGIELLASSL